MNEPIATAWILVLGGLLLAISTLSSRVSRRVGVPVFLLFLVLGMLAGSEGVGGIHFDDFDLSFRIGSVALALILFDGGLNTPYSAFRSAFSPAVVLATVGVAGTALLVALVGYYLGLDLLVALLLGAIVSSTDAAAVFSTLRASGMRLKKRVATTLELESGLNDPVAVILTITLTFSLLGSTSLSGWTLVSIVVQLVIGGIVGSAIGWLGLTLVGRMTLLAGGLYPVLTLAFAFLAFGLATVLNGSGFLAVYLAGLIIGNNRFPYRSGVLHFHDAIAWLSQVSMFLLLGLLVFPSQLLEVALMGVIFSAALVFFARPLIVFLCLVPFGFAPREVLYVSWVGLRGAIPIILATFPVLAGVDGAEQLFNTVFIIVVMTALIPGATVGWVTRQLNLGSQEPEAPRAMIDINAIKPLSGDVLSYYIASGSAVCGASVGEIPLPDDTTILLIMRDDDLIAPKNDIALKEGDHVYIYCQPAKKGLLNLMFGVREKP